MKTACLLLLSLTALAASGGPHFGVVAGLASPVGELRHHDQLGTHFGFSAHLGLVAQGRLNDRNELRGQLTFLSFPGHSFPASKAWPDYRDLQMGLDWVHGFRGLDRSAYMLVGVTVNRFQVSPGGPFAGSMDSQTQSGALGGKVGGGFAFSRRFRLEGQFNQVQIKRFGASGLGFTPAQWVQASAVFQF
ncbi:MAG: outer membrane beta-barrel protein [Acidobacteria bacterium]|nr:outer membrane beta-barrel protein [Acidobacteriota bacterium]